MKIAGVYTSVILGAGFASGAELLNFFVRFGLSGFYGLLLSGLFFAVLGFAVIELSRTYHITSHRDFISIIFGRLSFVAELIIMLFVGTIFSTMLAACGAIVRDCGIINTPFSFSAGVIGLGILCFIVFLFDLDALMKINALICPVMVIGGVVVGLLSFYENFYGAKSVFNILGNNWLFSSILYTSYNIITAVFVLVALSKDSKSKASSLWGSVLGSLCMTILGFSLFLALYFARRNVNDSSELPMLSILIGKDIAYGFYLLILSLAIFTTALANGFALISFLSHHMNPLLAKALVTILAMLLAHIGFSSFIGMLYPLFGYLGLIEIFLILNKWLSHP